MNAFEAFKRCIVYNVHCTPSGVKILHLFEFASKSNIWAFFFRHFLVSIVSLFCLIVHQFGRFWSYGLIFSLFNVIIMSMNQILLLRNCSRSFTTLFIPMNKRLRSFVASNILFTRTFGNVCRIFFLRPTPRNRLKMRCPDISGFWRLRLHPGILPNKTPNTEFSSIKRNSSASLFSSASHTLECQPNGCHYTRQIFVMFLFLLERNKHARNSSPEWSAPKPARQRVVSSVCVCECPCTSVDDEKFSKFIWHLKNGQSEKKSYARANARHRLGIRSRCRRTTAILFVFAWRHTDNLFRISLSIYLTAMNLQPLPLLWQESSFISRLLPVVAAFLVVVVMLSWLQNVKCTP